MPKSARKMNFGRTTVDLDHMAHVLREKRERLGLSQRQLAEKAGVAPTTVHNLEQGSCKVQLDKFLQVLAGLDLVPQHVLRIEDTITPVEPTPFELELLRLVRSRDVAGLLGKVSDMLREQK